VHILVSLFFSIAAEILFPKLFGSSWNEQLLRGDLLLIPYLLLVIALSHFSYKYVEMPGRKAILAYDFGGRLHGILLRLKLRST